MADGKRLTLGLLFDRSGTATPAFVSFTLNQSNDALEFVVQAPAAATISRLGIRLTSITGTTPTYRVSAQGVTSGGAPDGTIKGGTNNALKTFSPSGLGWSAGEWHWLDLDETFSVTRGEYFSIVVDYSSGTVDGSNNAAFTYGYDSTRVSCFPYAIQNNATVRTNQGVPVVVGWGSSTVAYGAPLETITNVAFNSGSTPDERAIKFSLPAAYGSTFKVLGLTLPFVMNGPGQTCTFILYDSDGTSVLQDVTHDLDHVTSTNARNATVYFNEATLATLNFGTTYYLSIRPDSASAGVSIVYLTFDSADDQAAWPGGDIFHQATQTNAGGWSPATAERILAGIIIDDLTEPSDTHYPMSAPVMQGFRPTMAAY